MTYNDAVTALQALFVAHRCCDDGLQDAVCSLWFQDVEETEYALSTSQRENTALRARAEALENQLQQRALVLDAAVLYVDAFDTFKNDKCEMHKQEMLVACVAFLELAREHRAALAACKEGA